MVEFTAKIFEYLNKLNEFLAIANVIIWSMVLLLRTHVQILIYKLKYD